jgi:hypothetical protein
MIENQSLTVFRSAILSQDFPETGKPLELAEQGGKKLTC